MSVAGQPPKLFGREREQQQLLRTIEAARSGRGNLLLVSGEAGIGKTSLVEEASRHASNLNMAVAFGRSYDLSTTPPYGPWIDILHDIVEPGGSVPFDPARHPDLPASGSQEGLFQQTRELLQDVAKRTDGLLIVLDDAHWADQASLDLLRFLNRSLHRSPIVLILTYRSDELSRHHPLYALIPTLVREARVERLELRPLDESAIGDWLKTAYQLPDSDERRLLTYAMENSEGNPFFSSEILRSLEEESVLTPATGSWMLARLPQMTVPLLLQQIIDARINRMPEANRKLLTTAAVIGHEVAFEAWQSATEAAHEDLIGVVEEADEIWLIDTDQRGDRFRFRHSLVREVLYQSISPPRRRIIHLQVAEILAADLASDPDSVAHHYQQAGDAAAIDWLIRAAERAWRSWAWTEAANRYQTAIELLAQLPKRSTERGWLLLRLAETRRYNTPRRALEHVRQAELLAEGTQDDVLTTAVLWVRGRILVATDENGLPDLEAAVAAMGAFDDAAKHRYSDHIGFHADHALPIFAVWLANFGRYEEALRASADFFRLVPSEERPPLIDAEAALAAGIAHAALGRPEAALNGFQQALDIYLQAGDLLSVSHTAYLFLTELVLPYFTDDLARRENLAEVGDAGWRRSSEMNITQAPIVSPSLLLIEGQWDDLRTITGRTMGLRNYVRIWTAPYGAEAARRRGDLELATAFVRAGLPPDHAFNEGSIWLSCSVQSLQLAAEIAMDADELGLAEHSIAACGDLLDASGRVTGRAEQALLSARLANLRGDQSMALTDAQAALALATNPRQPLALLRAHRMLGEIHLALDSLDDAVHHLTRAREIGEACSAVYENALTSTLEAQAASAHGDRERATALFDEALQVANDLGAQPLVERIEYVREQATPADQFPDNLTSREVDVLQFLTEGLTDAEIGEKLSISPRTVMTHVSRILGKTNSPSRAAAAAYAVRQGLA